jgi:hypothetical protein
LFGGFGTAEGKKVARRVQENEESGTVSELSVQEPSNHCSEASKSLRGGKWHVFRKANGKLQTTLFGGFETVEGKKKGRIRVDPAGGTGWAASSKVLLLHPSSFLGSLTTRCSYSRDG